MRLQDAKLIQTKALPNGAANAATDPIDLELTSRSNLNADVELLISAPALGATPMPDAKTMKYDVETSDTSVFTVSTVLAKEVIVQTGASSAGCAAKTARYRLPSDVKRYIRVRATGSASGDASGSSVTAQLVFGS